MTSLRNRLLALLIPLTVGALALAAFGIEGTVRRDLTRARDGQLLIMARGVGAAVEVEVDGAVEFDLEEGEIPERERGGDETYYAIADESGELLFSSFDPPAALLSGMGDEPRFADDVVDDVSLRICLLPIRREAESDREDREEWLEANPGLDLPEVAPRRFFVVVGMPDGDLREAVLLLRRRLAAGFAFLALALVILPVGAAVLSLRPLRRLSRQADEVGVDNPGARLGEEGVDGEVLPLVRALNSALDRLADAYRQQKRFTADAAHELRSPLSAIRTQCEVTLRRERSAAELREVLQSVHRTALRLGEVVENLLSLSRLRNGSAVIEMEEVDLGEKVREAAGILIPLAQTKDATVTTRLPDRIPATGDGHLLLECLSNLIDNAIRHSPPGGEVTVEGGAGPRPWISVADRGSGIEEEHREKVFERFYRVDPSRSREEGGSGLGLSIAREIARLHGGDITVEGRSGGGSLFTLEIGQRSEGA